jgi:two-component system, NtrC family, response regulator AtoC
MRILVVDDESMQRDMLKGFLVKNGHDVFEAADGAQALEIFEKRPFQLVLLDHRMPDMNGDVLLKRLKEINPLIRSIMITAFGSVDMAVAVMKLGVDDFIEKPVDLINLLNKIASFEQEIIIGDEAAQVTETLQQSKLPLSIIGQSEAMQEALSLVQRIAPTPWTVLIRGETGTGKDLFARLVHLISPYQDAPFVAVNCSAIPENLFESELFGHAQGAFTGATRQHRGRFEQAAGGSLFLDEIGDLPLTLQPKLLRAIQEKRFTRVGGEKDRTVEVRLIAATNRDLQQRTSDGHFREDLYYRLKVLEIELPPLRQHKEDVPELIDFFLKRYATRPLSFGPDASTILMKYHYPGNVRELEHIIQRVATLSRGTTITPADLPAEVRLQQATSHGSLNDRLAAVEREMIYEALIKNNWVQTKAARSLGISERVLRYKIKKHDLKNENIPAV